MDDKTDRIDYTGPPLTLASVGTTDADRAKDYHSRLMGILSNAAAVMTEAKANGMTISFAMSPADAFGRFGVAMLEISKKLA